MMDGNGELIVIVEDDAGLRRAVERLLRLSGFDTHAFNSAEDPGAVMWASSARCLIVDVQLPGASGLAFYEGLPPTRPPAIFVTAFDGPAARQAVMDAGGRVLLAKPFLGRDLLDAVRDAL
ncbi:response regulator [Paraburkholderia bannensis]|uniref:response regulator n=1 Tax=Paraburkholderia bannensis TaxID=765414 RepID=UPI002AB6D05A|nr:response regulator [Paraburkholderia bannensis]